MRCSLLFYTHNVYIIPGLIVIMFVGIVKSVYTKHENNTIKKTTTNRRNYLTFGYVNSIQN